MLYFVFLVLFLPASVALGSAPSGAPQRVLFQNLAAKIDGKCLTLAQVNEYVSSLPSFLSMLSTDKSKVNATSEETAQEMVAITSLYLGALYQDALELSLRIEHFGEDDSPKSSEKPTLKEIEHAVAGMHLILKCPVLSLIKDAFKYQYRRREIIGWLMPSQFPNPQGGKCDDDRCAEKEMVMLEDLLQLEKTDPAKAEEIRKWIDRKLDFAIVKRFEKDIKNFIEYGRFSECGKQITAIRQAIDHVNVPLLRTAINNQQQILFKCIKKNLKQHLSAGQVEKAFKVMDLIEFGDPTQKEMCNDYRQRIIQKAGKQMLGEVSHIASLGSFFDFDQERQQKARLWLDWLERSDFDGKDDHLDDLQKARQAFSLAEMKNASNQDEALEDLDDADSEVESESLRRQSKRTWRIAGRLVAVACLIAGASALGWYFYKNKTKTHIKPKAGG